MSDPSAGVLSPDIMADDISDDVVIESPAFSRPLAAPVPIRRAQPQDQPGSGSARSLSPDAPLSQSVPAGASAGVLRRGRAASNSGDLLQSLGSGLDLQQSHSGGGSEGSGGGAADPSDVLTHGYFGSQSGSAAVAALPPSLSFHHLPAASRAMQRDLGAGMSSGRARCASQLAPSSLSTPPAASASAGGYSTSSQPGAQGPQLSPAPPRPPRSWSLIDRGRRLFGGASGSEASGAVALHPRAESDLDGGALGGDWHDDGSARLPLSSSFTAASASAAAAANTRGRSQSHAPPPSSALAAQAHAAARASGSASASASSSRLLQSSPLVPAGVKSALLRLSESAGAALRCVDEYKQLLVRLRARRRQVLGTLASSMRRLGSWMQVAKLEVLQELCALQAELFDQEEAMLRRACVVLKERAAAVAEAQEDAEERIAHLLRSMEPAADAGAAAVPVDARKLSGQQKDVQARMHLALPSRALLDSLATQAPKQFALSHPALLAASGEHRALAARLEACKARYLAAARATDVEELEDRRTRMQRVVATLQRRAATHAQTQTAQQQAPPSPGDAASAAAATLALSAAAAAAAAARDSSPSAPPQLDYAPARDIELEFAKLLLDERTKEGRAVARFVADLEAAVSASTVGASVAAASSPAAPGAPTAGGAAAGHSPFGGASDGADSQESPHPDSRGAQAANGWPPPSAEGDLPRSLSALSLTALQVAPGGRTSASAAPSLAAVSEVCYDSISAFLHQVEQSCARDYLIPAAHRPALRLLIQRSVFPRIWKLVLQLGYEKDDLRGLPPVAGEEENEDEGDEQAPAPARLLDMSAREEQLQRQLQWLRTVSPLDLGIPITFLKPAPQPQPQLQPQSQPGTPARAKPGPSPSTTATPRSSFSSTSVLPGTPGRAPPSYKPAPPPALLLSPSGPGATSTGAARPPPAPSSLMRSYRPVVDTLEEIGQLVAPADMVACLLVAAKQIYTTAKAYVEAHEAMRQAAAAAAAGSAARSSPCESMSADGFFPIFLFVLVQSCVPNWLHRLKAMQRWALLESESMAEPAYYLTTLEAALIFVHQATRDNINPNKDDDRQRGATTAGSSKAGTPRTRRLSASGEHAQSSADKATAIDDGVAAVTADSDAPAAARATVISSASDGSASSSSAAASHSPAPLSSSSLAALQERSDLGQQAATDLAHAHAKDHPLFAHAPRPYASLSHRFDANDL